jgi:hypothetical protein
MERAVKVQVTTTMDMHLEAGQSKYQLARDLSRNYIGHATRNGVKITNVQVFEGHGDDSTLALRDPAIELGGQQAVDGWQLVRIDENRRDYNLRSDQRTVSDPTNSATMPSIAETISEFSDKPWMSKKEKNLMARLREKQSRRDTRVLSTGSKMSERAGVQKAKGPGPDDKKIHHNFERPKFNKLVRSAFSHLSLVGDRDRGLTQLNQQMSASPRHSIPASVRSMSRNLQPADSNTPKPDAGEPTTSLMKTRRWTFSLKVFPDLPLLGGYLANQSV